MKMYLYAFHNVYLNVFTLGQPNITGPNEIDKQFQAMAFRDPEAFASQNLPECVVYLVGFFDDSDGKLEVRDGPLPLKVCDLSTVYKAALRARKAKKADMEVEEDDR